MANVTARPRIKPRRALWFTMSSPERVEVGGDVARVLRVEAEGGHRDGRLDVLRLDQPALELRGRVLGFTGDERALGEAVERRADDAARAAHAGDDVAGAAA